MTDYRTKYPVTLEDHELSYIEWLAEKRRQNNKSQKIRDQKKGPQSGEEGDSLGYAGEWAATKFFGVYPNTTTQVESKSYDFLLLGYKVDVKTIGKPNLNLVCKNESKGSDVDIYLLVWQSERTALLGRYFILGWEASKVVWQDHNLKDLGHGSEDYLIPQHTLRPVEWLLNHNNHKGRHPNGTNPNNGADRT